MIESLIEHLSGLPKEAIVFVISALPIAELRGGIPVAVSMGMGWQKALLICALGNFVPVIPILLLLDPVARFLRRWRPFDRFLTWIFERTRRRSALVERYEAVGLMLFVAVPLPMTGAWAGALAAYLFRVRLVYATLAIAAGILIAGVIVTLATQGVLQLWRL
jgi:uncharacterized membrane protein